MQGQQHPENVESNFEEPLANQQKREQANCAAVAECALCTARPPSNVSSGPDLISCATCGLQAHLGCLAQPTLSPFQFDAANGSSAHHSAPSKLPQSPEGPMLCPPCLQAHQAAGHAEQQTAQLEAVCFICRESAGNSPVTSLGSYSLSESQEETNLETSPREQFFQLLSQGLQLQSDSVQSKLRSRMVHPNCLDRVLANTELLEDLMGVQNPLEVLLSEAFWNKFSSEGQLPLLQSPQLIQPSSPNSEAEPDQIGFQCRTCNRTVTEIPGGEQNCEQAEQQMSGTSPRGELREAEDVDEQFERGSPSDQFECNSCLMQKKQPSCRPTAGENQKKQVSIADMMRAGAKPLMPQPEDEEPRVKVIDFTAPPTKMIVHNLSTQVKSEAQPLPAIPKKVPEVQATTLAQSTLMTGTQTLEIGKRTRKVPNKTYEALIGQTEEAKRIAQKRARTDGATSDVIQTQLSLFAEPAAQGNAGKQIKLNLISRPTDSGQDGVVETQPAKTTYAEKKLMATDPFQNPFINEIFKPILAADKLQVLRNDKEIYDVFILPKDLKVFNKDKRDLLLANYDPSGEQLLDEEANNEEGEAEDDADDLTNINVTQQSSAEEAQSQKSKPKRRKKATNLSRQTNRRATPGAELSWIANLAKNRKLQEEQLASGKGHRRSRKSRSSRPESFRQEPSVLASARGETVGETDKPESDFFVQQLKQEIKEKEKEKEISQDIELKAEQNDKVPDQEQPDDNVIAETADQPEDPIKAEELVRVKSNDDPEDMPMVEETKGAEDGKEDENFRFTDKSQILTIDTLFYLYNMGYYHNLEDLQDDFKKLIDRTIRLRCKNELAKVYLQKVSQQSLQHLDRKKNDFTSRWRSYFEGKFIENQENPMVSFAWQKYPGAKRQYFPINDYKAVTTMQMGKLPSQIDSESIEQLNESSADFEELLEINRKMSTQKKSKCGLECPCQDQAIDMKPKLSQTDANIAAIAENRMKLSALKDEHIANVNSEDNENDCCFHRKVECGDLCGCNPELCRNRQMSLKQQLHLGSDVEERTAWGMDMCTAINLCTLRPRDIPAFMFSEFLEHRLLFSIQQQGEGGYDIRKALQFIIDSEPTYNTSVEDLPLDEDQLRLWNNKPNPFQFSYMEREFARVILSAIQQLKGQNDPHFRIHSKGLGIFCNRKEGIRQNSLLVEYFGEIYPSWLWYEKQDVLKQGQAASKLSKDLPDFYNITYERHFDDPAGYDVLTVDPILFGNFASRLSHSCNPNCETITKVKQDDGIYSIGMFTQKAIKYGEELCFNYCSFTESEEEYRSAACLCGSMICQGRFLNLAIAQKNQGLMKEYHTFVDRNLILYNAIVACSPEGEGITQQDQERLDKFGIKESVLKGIPFWLKKWAALICEFIEFEQAKYPETQEGKMSPEYVAIELKNLRDSKLSNIAITIDKVARILRLMKTELPPIRKMTQAEIYFALWSAQDSIKAQVEDVLHTIEDCAEVKHCFDFIENSNCEETENGPGDSDEDDFVEKVKLVRTIFLFISQELRGVKSQRVAISALCDNLVLYAKTETYFTPNDYSKCTSKQIHIRKCDVAGQAADQESFELAIKDQGRSVYHGTKEYQAHHIWGQLVGWYKQTVEKPNSSLSADRRGSLSLPDIHSFIVSAKNQENLKQGRTTKSKKRGKKDSEEFIPEVMPTQGSSSRGRSTRGAAAANGGSSQAAKPTPTYDDDGFYKIPQDKEMKIIYPHKKYTGRDQFLEHWHEFFAKNWDTVCHWSFKNKHRLYGSISFDSVLRAGLNRERRLDYFNEVVEELKGYAC